MESSKKLRQQHGIGVRQLARFIGTDHTLLFKAENNQRPMDNEAAAILAQMIALNASCPGPPPVEYQESPEDKAARLWQAREYRRQAAKLREKLQVMQSSFDQARWLSVFVPHLQAHAQWPLTARMLRTIEDWKEQSRKWLEDYHPLQQQRMMRQIAVLEAEAGVWEGELETCPSGRRA